jgi:predicted Rossmann-fold nucleotide-binding protein
MRLSHAVVVAPGGIGTLLELMYVWQLLQVGMIEPRPVILLDRELWTGLIAWMREQQLDKRFISPGDLDHIHLVDTPREVVKIIRRALEAYREQMEATVAALPEASRDQEAGRLMRAAVEEAAAAAPEAVSAATPEAERAPEADS